MTFSGAKQAGKRQIAVIMLHGIRDYGSDWMIPLTETLKNSGAKVVTYSYDLVTATMMSFPQFVRSSWEHRIRSDLDTVINEHSDACDVVIVAHSYGTYLVATTLQQNKQLRVKRIIFIGSIVNRHYNWDSIAHCFGNTHLPLPVLNCCGSHDPWPVVADWLDDDYGAVGTRGFRNGRVIDFCVNGDHSTLLTPKFSSEWIDFAINGVEPSRDQATPQALWGAWIKGLLLCITWRFPFRYLFGAGYLLLSVAKSIAILLVIAAAIAAVVAFYCWQQTPPNYEGDLTRLVETYEQIAGNPSAVSIFRKETDGRKVSGNAVLLQVKPPHGYILRIDGKSTKIYASCRPNIWREAAQLNKEVSIVGFIDSESATETFPIALEDCFDLKFISSSAQGP